VGAGNEVIGYAVANDSTGNVYVTGDLRNTHRFGPKIQKQGKRQSFFIAKVDKDGEFKWVAVGHGEDKLSAISSPLTKITDLTVADAGKSLYAVGYFTNTLQFGGTTTFKTKSKDYKDLFIAKLQTSDGKVLWIKTFGGVSDDVARAVVADSSGNVYVGGTFADSISWRTGLTSSISNHSGKGAAFVLRLTSGGVPVWAKVINSGTGDVVTALRVGPKGKIFLLGYAVGGAHPKKLSFQTTSGKITYNSNGYNFAFIASLEQSGTTYSWVKFLEGGTRALVYADKTLGVDGSGNAYVGVYHTGGLLETGKTILSPSSFKGGSSDFSIIKIDTSGKNLWLRHVGTAGNELVFSARFGGKGHLYIAGRFVRTGGATSIPLLTGKPAMNSPNTNNGFVAKVEPKNGNIIAARMVGSGPDMALYDLSVGVNEEVIAIGTHQVDLQLGLYKLKSPGRFELLVWNPTLK